MRFPFAMRLLAIVAWLALPASIAGVVILLEHQNFAAQRLTLRGDTTTSGRRIQQDMPVRAQGQR